MRKTYPRASGVSRFYRRGSHGCMLCHEIKPHNKNKGLMVEIQYSYMRGDDELGFLCHECSLTMKETIGINLEVLLVLFKDAATQATTDADAQGLDYKQDHQKRRQLFDRYGIWY